MPILPLVGIFNRKRSECDSDISCGQGAFCHYYDEQSAYGKCTPYFGLKVGEVATTTFDGIHCIATTNYRGCQRPSP